MQRHAKPLGYTWKQLYALLSHKTLSVIAPIFLKLVFVKLPDGMSRWSFELKLVCEILRVPIFVRVFFILSIRNLDSKVECVALNRRKH